MWLYGPTPYAYCSACLALYHVLFYPPIPMTIMRPATACIQAWPSLLSETFPCSQISNGNCDQGFKPTVSASCNQTPCAVSDSGLTLGFTDWGGCNVQCGSGYSQRTAYCMNPNGALADLSMCGNYSGEHMQPYFMMSCFRSDILTRRICINRALSVAISWPSGQ